MHSKINATGQLHIAFAALSSLTSMLAVLLVGLWLRGIPMLRSYGTYSLATVVLIFMTGGLSAVVIAIGGTGGGFLERFTIDSLLQRLLAIALACTAFLRMR